MKINWVTIKERTPKRYDGCNTPYINCIVYACNPETPNGGVIDICRWDVKNKCWFEKDIKRNWIFDDPYEITHFSDDVLSPYEK